MKSGGYRHGEEDAPAIAVAEDEEEDTGDGLDWALFGRRACFPSNKRPPVTSFLLGPLSVQKRVRATQRRATQRRAPVGPATRPQDVREGDITQSENSNLTHLVKGIKSKLETHLEAAASAAESELEELGDDVTGEDQAAVFARHRIAITPDEEPAVSLFDFAINPHDFGQTVENLFYISFLVREGNAQIVKDDDGLPLLGKLITIQYRTFTNASQHPPHLEVSLNNEIKTHKSIKPFSASTTPPGRCSSKRTTSENHSYRIVYKRRITVALGGTELSNVS
jgi:hypothetical protein